MAGVACLSNQVERGGHNPLDTPKSMREASNAAILAAVNSFIGRGR